MGDGSMAAASAALGVSVLSVSVHETFLAPPSSPPPPPKAPPPASPPVPSPLTTNKGGAVPTSINQEQSRMDDDGLTITGLMIFIGALMAVLGLLAACAFRSGYRLQRKAGGRFGLRKKVAVVEGKLTNIGKRERGISEEGSVVRPASTL